MADTVTLDDDEYSGRFWSRMSVDENGCWVWSGRRLAKGYGRLERNSKQVRAHRLAYELVNGPIPDGLLILHSCDNPPCCNPAHLRPGTARENLQDAISRGRFSGAIVKDRSDPRLFAGTLESAARELGVGKTTIWRIRNQAAANNPPGVIQE